MSTHPQPSNIISRRDFIEKSVRGAAAVAWMGAVSSRGLAMSPIAEVRPVQDRQSLRFMAGESAVCSVSDLAFASGPEVGMQVELLPDDRSSGPRRLRVGHWLVSDAFKRLSPGVFQWNRSWKNMSDRTLFGDLMAEVETSFAPSFFLVPGASYNGNHQHARSAPEGLADRSQPWEFSAYRATVPAATYSEGGGWSIFLFSSAERPSIDCACSLVPRDATLSHRLLWPGRDNIKAGATSVPCPLLAVAPGDRYAVVSYLVVCPGTESRKSWSNGLDVAWQLNRHDVAAWYPTQRLWSLGIQFAQRSLWYEKSDFTGFNVGLVRKAGAWRQRDEVQFESGWCGQNASLGVAMLQDFIWNKNSESLQKGTRALDFWAENGRLSCGLFYTHFDVKLGVAGFAPYGWGPYNATFLGRPAKPQERYVDTCNLGYGAYFYLLASELAGKCGLSREGWRRLGLDTCDFFVAHALADGTFGKAWSLDGRCLAVGGTTGSHLIWPLLKAYRMTGNEHYLATARRAFRTYVDRDLSQLTCWGSALDADCVDRESGQPLLLAALDLYEITGEQQYLEDAKLAGYYLATWQWHYSPTFPPDTQITQTRYDMFGGTSISVRGPGIDPWGAFLALGWMRLAKATGNSLWRDRGIQSFRQSTIGLSDGRLALNGLKRPLGSQNESMGLKLAPPCGRGLTGDYNDWLVAWPNALRLITLMHWSDWSDFAS